MPVRNCSNINTNRAMYKGMFESKATEFLVLIGQTGCLDFGNWNCKKLSELLNFFCSSLFPRFLHEIRKLMQGRINNPSHSSLPSYLTCSTKQDRVITSSNSLQVFTIKRNYNLPSPANFFFKKLISAGQAVLAVCKIYLKDCSRHNSQFTSL